MGTNKAAGEKTEDWKKQASGDERKMKWNRKLKMGIKNGSNGARTHDLSRVRRTLSRLSYVSMGIILPHFSKLARECLTKIL